MTTTAWEQYRVALEAKAAELKRTLRDRRLIEIENVPEQYEQMMLASQRDLSITTLDRNSRMLSEVKAALARLDCGGYGICESCGEAIKPKRLAAVPWTRYCLHCQERLDQGPSPSAAGLPAFFQMVA
jgi:DnaK suppressor protein